MIKALRKERLFLCFTGFYAGGFILNIGITPFIGINYTRGTLRVALTAGSTHDQKRVFIRIKNPKSLHIMKVFSN